MEDDSDQQSTQSESLVVSNDDLLTEILLRLPVTSILRFKSVCKHWRLLLTHTHFTHRYDNNFFKSPGIFGLFHLIGRHHYVQKAAYVPFDVEDRSTPPSLRSLDLYSNRSSAIIEQSCNGLLLCYTVHSYAREYYVFNPTTKQLAIVPSVPKATHYMALAFHQTHCAHYKLVCIALKPVGNLFQIQVYSSETKTWKICIESFSAQKLDFRYPFYWNGAVHWVPYYQTRSSFMYFKFDVEQLQILPVRKGLGSDEILMYLGESRGCLHLISRTDREEDTLRLNVYEMLRDHSEWVVKYRLQLDELLGDFPEVIRQYQTPDEFRNIFLGNKWGFRVLDVVRGKAEEDTFLVLLTPRKLLRYNVHDKSCKELYSNKDYSCEFASEFTSVHRYIETLSSF